MVGSKDRKTTIALEPGQVAIVRGMDDGGISRLDGVRFGGALAHRQPQASHSSMIAEAAGPC